MTETQQKLFWQKIALIQERHLFFFPEEQKEYIVLQEIDSRTELKFSDEYNLDDAITSEIQLAFKLTSTFDIVP
jgi:hypothetical protein